MDIPEQIIFLNLFFQDVIEFDAIIFGVGEMDLEVFKNISKLEN